MAANAEKASTEDSPTPEAPKESPVSFQTLITTWSVCRLLATDTWKVKTTSDNFDICRANFTFISCINFFLPYRGEKFCLRFLLRIKTFWYISSSQGIYVKKKRNWIRKGRTKNINTLRVRNMTRAQFAIWFQRLGLNWLLRLKSRAIFYLWQGTKKFFYDSRVNSQDRIILFFF